MNLKESLIFLLIFFNFLNFLDLITTFIGVNIYTFTFEGNMNVIWLIQNFGWFGFSFIKILGCFAVSFILYLPSRSTVKNKKTTKYLLVAYNIVTLFACIVYLIVVIFNFIVIL